MSPLNAGLPAIWRGDPEVEGGNETRPAEDEHVAGAEEGGEPGSPFSAGRFLLGPREGGLVNHRKLPLPLPLPLQCLPCWLGLLRCGIGIS